MRAFTAGMAILILGSIVWAAKTPHMLRLQGRFTDISRTPITDNLPVRFSVWDAEDGYGNLLWQEVQTVPVQENRFQVVLGRGNPLPPSVFSGEDRWVELQIASEPPLRPRHKIPSQYIREQVEAPAPPPEERRELELQIDKYKEEAPPVQPPKPKPVQAVRPKPVPAPPSAGTEEPGTVYVVQAGDTLKSIAKKLYRNAEFWYDLYYLNKDRLGPMGHLYPGQRLVLPGEKPVERPKS